MKRVPRHLRSPNSQGTNRLIKEGAKLVECAEDILEELEFSYLKKEDKQVLDREIPSLRYYSHSYWGTELTKSL